MRKFLALAFLGLITLTVVSSCASKGGHCDAYGSTTTINSSNDLAAK
jgi:hypothetical protein